MQLAAADPGRADLDYLLAGGRVGLGDIEQLHPARRREDERLHRGSGREMSLRYSRAVGLRCSEFMSTLCAIAEALKRRDKGLGSELPYWPP
jgi:hypothetical protein